MSDSTDPLDNEEQQVAKLLAEDRASTSDLHDATVQAAIEASAQRIKDRQASSGGSSGAPRPWAMALAASLVAAMVVVYVAPWNNGGDDVVRSVDPGGEVYPASQSILATAPERFAWPMQPTTRQYEFTLRDNSGVSIWTGISDGAEIVLDPAIRAELKRDVSYVWSVRTAGGGPGRELGPYWFQITE